ncbi:hypothetical protein K501DRAFT_280342 [Backusella circina FSU 941]|nr:hypothetical protein K501DRAFT_280342 [Backusella circina FSU 941]
MDLLFVGNRKQEIIDDFREEQIENLKKNWDKFDTQTTKAVSKKLRQRIIDYIIKPILQTADVLDQFLANTGQTFADCTQNTMAYLMLSHAWKTLNISLSPVEMRRLTNMPNYDSVKARKYIIQRMKELAGSENMARFRYIAAESDLPTDSQIIVHLVETYISIKNPSVIPPLIQDHFGDVFKYLVIYFYITPELDWKLFDTISS